MPLEMHLPARAKTWVTAVAPRNGGSGAADRALSAERLNAPRVDVVSAFDRKDVLPLLVGYPHKPLSRSYSRSDQKSAEWMLTDAAQPGGILLQARRGGRLTGVTAFSPLSWESEIFGFGMGTVRLIAACGEPASAVNTYRLLLEELTLLAAERGFRHLSCRVPSGEAPLIRAAEQTGFLLADSTLEYSWRTRRLPDPASPAALKIRPVQQQDLAALMDLAREAFAARTSTRFLNDPHLPPHRVSELYAEWTRQSCEGSFADVVMVAVHAGVPVGFLTCKIEREVSRFFGRALATIGIGAVRPDYEGRGLFAALARAVLKWCAGNGIEFVRSRIMVQHVASSWNALRTGARQTAAFHMFHRWIDDRGETGGHE